MRRSRFDRFLFDLERMSFRWLGPILSVACILVAVAGELCKHSRYRNR